MSSNEDKNNNPPGDGDNGDQKRRGPLRPFFEDLPTAHSSITSRSARPMPERAGDPDLAQSNVNVLDESNEPATEDDSKPSRFSLRRSLRSVGSMVTLRGLRQ